MLWWTLRQFESRDQSKRIKAAKKLGASSDPRVIKPLVATLSDENSDVRKATTEALERIGAPTVKELLQAYKKHGNHEYVKSVIARLLQNDWAIKPLVEAFKYGETTDVATEMLRNIGLSTVNELIEASKYASEDIQNRMVTLLCDVGNNEQGIEFLAKSLKDDANITIIRALGGIGKQEATGALMSLLENKMKDERVRRGFRFKVEWEAAIELAKSHHPNANHYLEWAIRDARGQLQSYDTGYQNLNDTFGAKSFVDTVHRRIEDYLQRATQFLNAGSQTKHEELSFIGGQVKTIDGIADEQGRKLGIQMVYDKALALSRKADELRRNGNYEKAIQLYKEAIRIQPDFFDAHNNLGLTYFETGKNDDAIAEYSQALLVKPDYIGGEPAHINFANVLKSKELSAETIGLYKQIVDRLPENPIQHCILGHLYEEAKMYDSAAREYEVTLGLTNSGEWADMAREGLQLIHAKMSG